MSDAPARPGLYRSRGWTIAFHTAWIVILLFAACWRFSLPLSPITNGDVAGFLNPALSALSGHGFRLFNSQPFIYPGLIYGLLAVFKDFRSITVLSDLLGLGAGVLLLASWRLAGDLLPHPRISGRSFDMAGLAVFTIWLFAPAPTVLAYALMSDSICPFFAALSLFLTVRFLHSRGKRSGGSALAWGGAALFAAFLLATLKPSFWISGMLSTIPVWLALFDRREKIAHRVLTVGIALAAIFLLLILPQRHFGKTDPMNKTFFPESVFSIHALLIREQLAADVMTPDPASPYSQGDLRITLGRLDDGIRASRLAEPRRFPSLGYDADFLMHRGIFFPDMAGMHGRDWALGLYRYYYLRTWEKRPGSMAAKVLKQLSLFYNFDCPVYHGRRIHPEQMYRKTAEALNDPNELRFLAAWPLAARALRSQPLPEDSVPEIRMPWLLDKTLDVLGATYFPIFVLCLAALPWALFGERRARFGGLIAVLALGYAYSCGNNLGIAIFHTLEVDRYSYVQFATALFSQMLGLIFLAEVLMECMARKAFARVPLAAQRRPRMAFQNAEALRPRFLRNAEK